MKLFGLEISLASKREDDFTDYGTPTMPMIYQRGSLETSGISAVTNDKILMAWGGYQESAAGVNVTPDTAMQASAVYACIRLIAENIATLPCILYERLSGGGRVRAVKHYLYSILHDAPNPEITSIEFFECMLVSLLRRGNAYAEIVRDGAGRVAALWPIPTDRVCPKRLPDKTLAYEISLVGGEKILLFADEILHIRGLSGDGIVGFNPIQIARDAIGLSLATQEYGARFFANDATPGGVLEHPGQLGVDAHTSLKKDWEDKHQPMSQKHRIAILEEGMKFHQMSMSSEDAQFLETRKFQKEEICSIYGVPPYMLGVGTTAAKTIEQQGLEFTTYTLRPWCARIEKAISLRLLSEKERSVYYAEWLMTALMRGDIKTRYESYNIAKQGGWMNADEIRETENMNPIPDGAGQVYLAPVNMVPLDQIGKVNPGTQNPTPIPGTGGRMASIMEPLVRDAQARIFKRMEADISRLVKKGKSPEEREQIVQEYYAGEALKKMIDLNFGPILEHFGRLVGGD